MSEHDQELLASPLWSILESTGLHAESCSHAWRTKPGSSYYGFNVSKTHEEPVDQIHGFIAAKRIQDSLSVSSPSTVPAFNALVAGEFEILNATSLEDLQTIHERNRERDLKKKLLFERIFRRFDLNGRVWVSTDIFSDSRFWETFADVLMDSRFSRGNLINDAMQWYNSRDDLEAVIKVGDLPDSLVKIPSKIRKRICSWPASILYTPLEVSEAAYFARHHGVSVKIGHMGERVYDKYIIQYVDVVHLRQPTDFKMSRLRPRGVTPYIHKDRPRDPKVRIFFGDTADDIRARLDGYPVEDYIETISESLGPLFNPYIDKAVLAVESAVCSGQRAVSVAGLSVGSGRELVLRLWRGELGLEALARALPALVADHICAIGKEV